jgi:hypothetical protein
VIVIVHLSIYLSIHLSTDSLISVCVACAVATLLSISLPPPLPLYQAGELPLAIVALVARMRSPHRTTVTQVDLSANMGFTLPQDIGNLDPSIRSVNLARCALTGD